MPEEKRLIFFYPTDNRAVRTNIGRWLEENNGQLPLEDLERRLQERFNYVSKSTHTEAEMRVNTLKPQIDKAYRLKNGIVYQR